MRGAHAVRRYATCQSSALTLLISCSSHVQGPAFGRHSRQVAFCAPSSQSSDQRTYESNNSSNPTQMCGQYVRAQGMFQLMSTRRPNKNTTNTLLGTRFLAVNS